MKISEFKSGEYEQQYEYRSFLPGAINREWTLSDPQILTLLEEANRLSRGAERIFSAHPRCGFLHPDAHHQGSHHLQPYRGHPDQH